MTIHRPKDATGRPIDKSVMYEAITPHFRGHRVFPGGFVMRGDDPDVLAAPQLWVRQDLPAPQKRQARVRHVASRRADVPPEPPDPTRTRILGTIPPEFRVRAIRAYVDRTGRYFVPGDIADARDEWVVANPELFQPEAA